LLTCLYYKPRLKNNHHRKWRVQSMHAHHRHHCVR
jgi:hypothetical protein